MKKHPLLERETSLARDFVRECSVIKEEAITEEKMPGATLDNETLALAVMKYLDPHSRLRLRLVCQKLNSIVCRNLCLKVKENTCVQLRKCIEQRVKKYGSEPFQNFSVTLSGYPILYRDDEKKKEFLKSMSPYIRSLNLSLRNSNLLLGELSCYFLPHFVNLVRLELTCKNELTINSQLAYPPGKWKPCGPLIPSLKILHIQGIGSQLLDYCIQDLVLRSKELVQLTFGEEWVSPLSTLLRRWDIENPKCFCGWDQKANGDESPSSPTALEDIIDLFIISRFPFQAVKFDGRRMASHLIWSCLEKISDKLYFIGLKNSSSGKYEGEAAAIEPMDEYLHVSTLHLCYWQGEISDFQSFFQRFPNLKRISLNGSNLKMFIQSIEAGKRFTCVYNRLRFLHIMPFLELQQAPPNLVASILKAIGEIFPKLERLHIHAAHPNVVGSVADSFCTSKLSILFISLQGSTFSKIEGFQKLQKLPDLKELTVKVGPFGRYVSTIITQVKDLLNLEKLSILVSEASHVDLQKQEPIINVEEIIRQIQLQVEISECIFKFKGISYVFKDHSFKKEIQQKSDYEDIFSSNNTGEIIEK